MAARLLRGRKPAVLRRCFDICTRNCSYFFTSEISFRIVLHQRTLLGASASLRPRPPGGRVGGRGATKEESEYYPHPAFQKVRQPLRTFFQNIANLHQHFSKCPAKLANFFVKVRTPQQTFSGMTRNISAFFLNFRVLCIQTEEIHQTKKRIVIFFSCAGTQNHKFLQQ
jgi:hypothetical protein